MLDRVLVWLFPSAIERIAKRIHSPNMTYLYGLVEELRVENAKLRLEKQRQMEDLNETIKRHLDL